MSSKKTEENAPAKKRFSLFKSKAPVVSPSKDNNVKIQAMSPTEMVAGAISAVVHSAVKKSRKVGKTKVVTPASKPADTPAAAATTGAATVNSSEPAKNLKKTKKSANAGSHELPPVAATPTLPNTNVGAGAAKAESRKRAGSRSPSVLATVPENDTREKAATKIQAAFRGQKERRQYVQKQKDIVKVEAVARGFLTRKRVAKLKSSNVTSEAPVTEEVPKESET